MNGTDVLILVEISPGVFSAVASQRGAQLAESTALRDLSSKDTGRARFAAAGRYEANISFDALFVESDAAFAALRDAKRNGTEIKLRKQDAGIAVEEANAIITSMTTDFPDQEEATISLEAAVNGFMIAI